MTLRDGYDPIRRATKSRSNESSKVISERVHDTQLVVLYVISCFMLLPSVECMIFLFFSASFSTGCQANSPYRYAREDLNVNVYMHDPFPQGFLISPSFTLEH